MVFVCLFGGVGHGNKGFICVFIVCMAALLDMQHKPAQWSQKLEESIRSPGTGEGCGSSVGPEN